MSSLREVDWELLGARRRTFDLMASAIPRFIPIDRWFYNNTEVHLPFIAKTKPDQLHVFRTGIEVPETRFSWFLKILVSGNALLKVNGRSYAGVDEAHTYVRVSPGRHSLELAVSPRSLFGYHRWLILFEKAYAVEAIWDIIAFSLRMLKLVDFVNQSLRDNPLRKELRDLVLEVSSSIRVTPSVSQIALALSLIYEAPSITPTLRREEVGEAYGDYLWLSGVYGIGVLEGDFRDIGKADVIEVLEVYREARDSLYRGLEELRKRYGKDGLVYIAGHSHIDAAWLWPKNETIEKVLRTFSTIARLAREYDFVYVQSSAQYYRWIEERDRELFEEIKKLVKEGRWLIVGGTWVESDTQLIDGESLARQFLYGQRYFLSRFGKIARIGWLPDSFGFSGNLPQIMRLSGIEVFITHKVVWNDTNEFPYHTFSWVGVDGTEMPTQILITSYNEVPTPSALARYWSLYKNKAEAPFTVFSYGYGDGGRGPTREMLEHLELLELVPLIPRVEHINEDRYVSNLKSVSHRIPKWFGELYVEIHRGTYTTNLEMKELMAKAESTLIEAEVVSSTLAILGKAGVDKGRVDELWRIVLFNQFHDILPGSSVKEVYDEASRELSEVIDKARDVIEENLKRLEVEDAKIGLLVFNVLPWGREEVVKIGKDLGIPVVNGKPVECQEAEDGYYVYLRTPPLGYRVYELEKKLCSATLGVRTYREGSGIVLENEYLRVLINGNGDISSIKLVREGVEILGDESNKLVAYVDKPGLFDAWEVREDSMRQGEAMGLLSPPKVSILGELVSCVDVVKGYRSSTVSQRICLYKNSPVIEVQNKIRWHEKSTLVKTWFTLDAEKTSAFYDIPYGVIERPTSRDRPRDKAMFEVPAVRWVSIYGNDKGLAIAAPSRHGYTAIGNRIGLSLIRSPMFPNPWSDVGEYETLYYIYPHLGDYNIAEVPKIVQQLIHRPITFYAKARGEESVISIEPPRAILGAFKVSEDLDGYIIRLYNPYKEKVKTVIRFSSMLKISRALEVNMIETEVLSEIPIKGSAIELEIEPQKIKTLKIILKP